MDQRVGREAAEGPGLEELEEAGVLQFLDGGVGNAPEFLGFGGALAQTGGEVTDRCQDVFGHGASPFRVVAREVPGPYDGPVPSEIRRSH